MRVRKLGALVAIIMAATGLFSVQPAEAQTVVAEICIVVGSVTFGGTTQHAYIPPTPPGGAVAPYPANTAATYTFVGVNFICAGVTAGSGVCNATSTGSTDPANPAAGEASGGFAGTYTNTCDIGGCAGNVGGPTNNMNPPSPGPGTAPWSWTSGPFITGYIDCGTGTASVGAVALIGAPDVTDPATVIPTTPGDHNGDGTAAEIRISYNKIIVAGVAATVNVTV